MPRILTGYARHRRLIDDCPFPQTARADGHGARRTRPAAPGVEMLPSLNRGLPECEPMAAERLRCIGAALMASREEAGVVFRDEFVLAEWDQSVGVNVEAPFRFCRAAIALLAPGSAIVNVASCHSLRPGHAAYCMTKVAIASLTQRMQMDNADKGNCVSAVVQIQGNRLVLHTGFVRRDLSPGRSGWSTAGRWRNGHCPAGWQAPAKALASTGACPSPERTRRAAQSVPGKSRVTKVASG